MTTAELAALVAALRTGGSFHPPGATYLVPVHPSWLATPARRGEVWARLARLAELEALEGEAP